MCNFVSCSDNEIIFKWLNAAVGDPTSMYITVLLFCIYSIMVLQT